MLKLKYKIKYEIEQKTINEIISQTVNKLEYKECLITKQMKL